MVCLIKNKIWRIYEVSATFPKLMKDDGTYVLGVCYPIEGTIYINQNLSDEKYRHVLSHELCHAFFWEYNFRLDTDLEERLCNFFADRGAQMVELVDRLLFSMLEVA